MSFFTDLCCCGTGFPLFVIIAVTLLLYLKKNNLLLNLKLRRLNGNNDAMVVLSRLLALGIPMIILIILNTANAFGFEVWAPLLSISFALALLLTGVIILVLGLKVGFYYPAIIILLIWIVTIYVYIQFEANLI